MTTEAVAPHAGAWIEMRGTAQAPRGTKVAPHAGAWIEIPAFVGKKFRAIVAPHAGAWIEILSAATELCCSWSRPTRARGLKFMKFCKELGVESRAPRGRVD